MFICVYLQFIFLFSKLRTEAVGEERDRMARELHDTLEQQLSGVALQLDSLDHTVNQNPAAASTSLSLARRKLRYTRLEARRSVWVLRSKVLEEDVQPTEKSHVAHILDKLGAPDRTRAVTHAMERGLLRM